ncbi:MAG: type VI secretion system ImpH/TssG family protein [Candidatus Endobugula sp.]|jgi:type VI secretion system ImpH/TssG family protein
MASAYWRTNHTIKSLLKQREVGWEFLQLVKTLLLMAKDKQLDNDNAVLDTLTRSIEFKGSLASDFPPGEIRNVENQNDDTQPTKIIMSNGVLSTTEGPLPEPFIAWIKDLAAKGDHTMADFLDLFNNRLMALRYLVCRTTRPNLIDVPADESYSGELFQALSGAFFNRSANKTDISLSGLLANSRMSFPVIKQLLQFEMGLPLLKLNAYQGGWLLVDESDHSQLGNPDNSRLGHTATLGSKVWDQQQAIELVIDTLPWAEVSQLVPGGAAHSTLVALLRRITDCRCDCKVVLLLPANQIPTVTLGKGLIDGLEGKRLERRPTEDKQLFSTVDKTEKKVGDNVHSKNASNTIVIGNLALGLTTALPVAPVRSTEQQKMKIRFIVETSNPSLSIENDKSLTWGAN